MARVLVAGCGYVGSELAHQLCDDGHQVWGLRRSGGPLPEGVSALRRDLGREPPLLPIEFELVAYTAAPSGGGGPDAYREVYVDGLRNLLTALASQATPPRRVVFSSSTGVYGDARGDWVDEQTPTRPERPTGQLLLEAERLLLEHRLPGCVLRFGGIYGPGRTRLIERAKAGAQPCSSRLWTNRIHRDDCAGSLRHLLHLESIEPVYLGVDDEPALECDVLSWLADRLGATPPVPDTGPAPRANKRCRNRLLRASGFELRYPSFREGYSAVLSQLAG